MAVMRRREPELELPARSTVAAILKREGLVKGRRRRRRHRRSPWRRGARDHPRRRRDDVGRMGPGGDRRRGSTRPAQRADRGRRADRLPLRPAPRRQGGPPLIGQRPASELPAPAHGANDEHLPRERRGRSGRHHRRYRPRRVCRPARRRAAPTTGRRLERRRRALPQRASAPPRRRRERSGSPQPAPREGGARRHPGGRVRPTPWLGSSRPPVMRPLAGVSDRIQSRCGSRVAFVWRARSSEPTPRPTLPL